MNRPVIVIGGGLFGSVARDTLDAAGVPTLLIDDNRPGAGSKPAGCLIKPSWLSSMKKDRRDGALAHLDTLYGIRSVPIRIGPVKLDSVLHVSPTSILRQPDVTGTVVRVDMKELTCEVRHPNTLKIRRIEGSALVIATGVWAKELAGEVMGGEVVGRSGMSFRFDHRMDEAKMKVWAPYKQSIAFNITEDVTWFGDGTSIKPENWDEFRYFQRGLDHASELDTHLHGDTLISTSTGIRPIVKGMPGLFQRYGRRTWVLTGGGKNGVAQASDMALMLRDQIS